VIKARLNKNRKGGEESEIVGERKESTRCTGRSKVTKGKGKC
jgi:hypothetical protein